MSGSEAHVTGRHHPAGSSRAAGARLEKLPDAVLRLSTDEGHSETHALANCIVSARVGSIPRRITLPDGSLFETGDNDGVDALLGKALPNTARLVTGLERFHPRLIAVTLAAILAVWGLFRFGMPVLVEAAVAVTPPAVPQMMGKGVLQSLDMSVFSPTALDKEKQHVLLDGFNALARLTPRGPDGYSLNFRTGGAIGPNAFALPDGTVILTDELVSLAGNDEEAILGVLAHELGHVEHQDSLRQLYRAGGFAAMLMFIGGDIGSGLEDVLAQGAGLAGLSYNRGQEASADRYSVELMHRAGKDPAAIARFFKLLAEKLGDKGGNDFFSTHPATPKRIEDAEAMAAEIRKDGK